MINHKVVYSQAILMCDELRYTTHLSLNLVVKEFLKLINIWRSYRQSGRLFHAPHSLCTFVLKDAELAR